VSCLSCVLQCGLETDFWTGINHLFIWGSIASYFVVTLVTHTTLFHHYYEGVAFNCMITANFWFTMLLCVVILLVPVLAEKFYYVDTRPSLTDKVTAFLLQLFLLYSVSKKTRLLKLILHNFNNLQSSLIILVQRDLIQFSIHYSKKILNWLRTSCVVSITTAATWHNLNSRFLGRLRTMYHRHRNKRVAKRLSVPKYSIWTRVTTFDTAKYFIILIETLFVQTFTFSVHKAA